jgi:hypothetical protein
MKLAKNMDNLQISVTALGSIGSICDGGHELVDLPIACAMRAEP